MILLVTVLSLPEGKSKFTRLILLEKLEYYQVSVIFFFFLHLRFYWSVITANNIFTFDGGKK